MSMQILITQALKESIINTGNTQPTDKASALPSSVLQQCKHQLHFQPQLRRACDLHNLSKWDLLQPDRSTRQTSAKGMSEVGTVELGAYALENIVIR